jgi:predicted dehydrogenase
MKKKIAVVGFGFMGMTHAINIIKNERLELVAIIDKDLDGISAKLIGEKGNFSTGDIDPNVLAYINKYSDLESCLESESLDAVHICVHTDLHYSLAKQALDAGLHVFLEKPMTLDVSKGEELVALANSKNLTFMVGHVLRFMAPYQKLKHWINAQIYGPLRFLSMSRYSGVPSWGQWKEKQSAYGSSGGALFDLLIHDIDFVNHILGAPDHMESIVLPGALSAHDYISSIWNYHEKDIKVKLEGGNNFHSTFPFHAGFMANFENASVFYTTLKPSDIQVANNEELLEIPAEDGTDGFYNEIDYFYQCATSAIQPLLCLPESSLQSIKICYRLLNNNDKQ